MPKSVLCIPAHRPLLLLLLLCIPHHTTTTLPPPDKGSVNACLLQPTDAIVVVYWAILAPSGFRSTFSLWTNVSHHALNSVFALFEIVCPRTAPLPWLDLIPIVICLALYLALAYVTHATQGFYTYGFLDLQEHSSGIVAAYIIGILVAGIIIFLIVRYVIVLRVWVIETKLGKMGKFSSHAPRRTLHEGEADAELAEKGVRVDDVATK